MDGMTELVSVRQADVPLNRLTGFANAKGHSHDCNGLCRQESSQTPV